MGSLGEAMFFGVMFLIGSVSLAALLTSHIMYPREGAYEYGFGFRLVVLVMASLILIGGGGVVRAVLQVGTSAERRSVLARRAADIQFIGNALQSTRAYPNVPADANLTNSPGTRLAFRLPMGQSPAWRLLAAAVFCLVWNGIASVLVTLAVNSHLAGDPEWFLTFFAAPMIVVGIWSMYYFIQQMLIHTGIGPTVVEISNHPLFPGQCYDIVVSQAGRLKVRALEVQLICQEEATYHQGTDIRTEFHTTLCQRVLYRENFAIEPGMPFEQRASLRIPQDVMHSFQANYSGVHWKLVVHGDAESWPPFQRSFPIIVYPAIDGGKEI